MRGLDWPGLLSRQEPASRLPPRTAAGRLRALAAAALAGPLAILLFLGLAPAQYRAETQIFIAGAAQPHFPLASAATLIASHDFARRALTALDAWERPEFGGGRGGDDEALAAFSARLSASLLQRERILAVSFRSGDPAFAARAADRLAALLVETAGRGPERSLSECRPPADKKALQIQQCDPVPGDRIQSEQALAPTPILASVVAPAKAPRTPVFPSLALLAAVGAGAMLAMTLGLAAALGRPRRAAEAPPPAPRPIGDGGVVLRLGDALGDGAAGRFADAAAAEALDEAAARILAARKKPARAARILCARLGAAENPLLPLMLARRLAAEGRSILIDLGDGAPTASGVAEEPGFAELVTGEACFAGVIRRDSASRLHLVAPGRGGFDGGSAQPADELASILDALDGAYDFIWLAAFAPAPEAFRSLAAQADVVVLAAPAEARATARASLAGLAARELLVMGAPARGLSLDAA